MREKLLPPPRKKRKWCNSAHFNSYLLPLVLLPSLLNVFLAIKTLSIFYWFNLFKWLVIQPTKKPFPLIKIGLQRDRSYFLNSLCFLIAINVFLKYEMKTLRKQIPTKSRDNQPFAPSSVWITFCSGWLWDL